jgi:hypothetical protein
LRSGGSANTLLVRPCARSRRHPLQRASKSPSWRLVPFHCSTDRRDGPLLAPGDKPNGHDPRKPDHARTSGAPCVPPHRDISTVIVDHAIRDSDRDQQASADTMRWRTRPRAIRRRRRMGWGVPNVSRRVAGGFICTVNPRVVDQAVDPSESIGCLLHDALGGVGSCVVARNGGEVRVIGGRDQARGAHDAPAPRLSGRQPGADSPLGAADDRDSRPPGDIRLIRRGRSRRSRLRAGALPH